MEKQDVIKKAYQDAGVDWELVKDYVDDNGWINIAHHTFTDEVFNLIKSFLRECDIKGALEYRPKSLAGIEDNNGWITIEGEDTNILPTEKGDYFGLYPDGSISCFFFNPEDDFDRELFLTELTHWQPIIKPSKPLY
ncbi:MAG TPA: hypothetical protein VEA37_12775 [Flavobacterium sp.]|nr:hypothetical protein [Flavobacterium sp.]